MGERAVTLQGNLQRHQQAPGIRGERPQGNLRRLLQGDLQQLLLLAHRRHCPRRHPGTLSQQVEVRHLRTAVCKRIRRAQRRRGERDHHNGQPPVALQGNL